MNDAPRIAIIGGTGLSQLTAMQAYDSEWPGTPYGEPNSPMVHTRLGGEMIIFMARHGEGGAFAPHLVNYRANLFALKQAGVEKVIAVNAVGGITDNMLAEHICIPDQIIDYTYGRESTYYDGKKNEVKHIDFTYPFNSEIRDTLAQSARELEIEASTEGVYGCTQGPRLETAAEINRMERDGCDVVGMTAMPEAALARELELDYASICLVVNRAAGRSEAPITPPQVYAALQQGMPQVEKILRKAVQLLAVEIEN